MKFMFRRLFEGDYEMTVMWKVDDVMGKRGWLIKWLQKIFWSTSSGPQPKIQWRVLSYNALVWQVNILQARRCNVTTTGEESEAQYKDI